VKAVPGDGGGEREGGRQMQKVTRRRVLAAASALPLVCIQSRAAGAAEFKLKFASGQDPSHPVNTRAQEAIDRIEAATGGRVEINLFPANQLGSDTDLISQLRFGAVDFLNIAGVVLATFVPRVGIVSTGFAFPSYDVVWKAMDGELGVYLKGEIQAVGVVLACKAWNNGFRQLTSTTREIRTPDDLKGFKMRVPAAPILTSLFQALGAGPTPINFNELFRRCKPESSKARRTRCPSSQRPSSMSCRNIVASRATCGTPASSSRTVAPSRGCLPTSKRSSPASSIRPRTTSAPTRWRSPSRCAPN
jgi:hypothetical protein